MVEIGKPMAGCRYWGYQVLSNNYKAGRKLGTPDQIKADRQTIKAKGYKPGESGLTKEKAVAEATKIEEQTGVKMYVFNHDYM